MCADGEWWRRARYNRRFSISKCFFFHFFCSRHGSKSKTQRYWNFFNKITCVFASELYAFPCVCVLVCRKSNGVFVGSAFQFFFLLVLPLPHIRCFLGNKDDISFIFTQLFIHSLEMCTRNPMNFTTSTSSNMKWMPYTHTASPLSCHRNGKRRRKSLIHKWVRASEYLCAIIWMSLCIQPRTFWCRFLCAHFRYCNAQVYNTMDDKKKGTRENGISFGKQNRLTFPVYLIHHLTQRIFFLCWNWFLPESLTLSLLSFNFSQMTGQQKSVACHHSWHFIFALGKCWAHSV